MNTNAPTPVTGYSDEIDLFELVQNLWKQKLLIISVTIMVTALAAAYAFLSAPVYESKSSILPPRLADIAGYNFARSPSSASTKGSNNERDKILLPEFTVKDVYSVFIKNLRSEASRRNFFEQVYLPFETRTQGKQTQDKLWEDFNKILSVVNSDLKISPDLFEVRILSVDASQAAKWVNLYVEQVAKRASQDMKDAIEAQVNTRAMSIKIEIDLLRESARKLRQDRIVKLDEALIVANKVGAQELQQSAGRTPSDVELRQFVDGNLIYMRGAKAIRAELEVLQNRKNDDPFIAGLRELENQLDFLAKVSVSPDGVAVFTLDRAAQVPETPIKPKKTLILALGFVLGGMFGIFIALIRSMLAKRSESIA